MAISTNADSAIDLPTPQRPVVLFDGGCPMCSRETAHYRRVGGAEAVDRVDIATADSLLARYGVSPDTAMARFHVRDPQGRWQTGAWGFVELWSHLSAYRWLARGMRSLRRNKLRHRFHGGADRHQSTLRPAQPSRSAG